MKNVFSINVIGVPKFRIIYPYVTIFHRKKLSKSDHICTARIHLIWIKMYLDRLMCKTVNVSHNLLQTMLTLELCQLLGMIFQMSVKSEEV